LRIFGDNLEDRLGHATFAVFYLLCGLAATFAQLAFSTGSNLPSLGTSGAIAGVLGAYILLFPKGRVRLLQGQQVIQVPALIVIGMWIAPQFVSGIGSIGDSTHTGGVAYMAHIGGFLAGFVLTFLFRGRGGAQAADQPGHRESGAMSGGNSRTAPGFRSLTRARTPGVVRAPVLTALAAVLAIAAVVLPSSVGREIVIAGTVFACATAGPGDQMALNGLNLRTKSGSIVTPNPGPDGQRTLPFLHVNGELSHSNGMPVSPLNSWKGPGSSTYDAKCRTFR
jgi:hypothetical protein